MTLTKENKLEAIAAKRGPLEHEKYAAELDLATAEEAKDEALAEEPKARLAEINSKLGALELKEKEAKKG